MDVKDDIRAGDAENIVIALELSAQAYKPLAAEIVLREAVTLYHGSHGAVEHEYLFGNLFLNCGHVVLHLGGLYYFPPYSIMLHCPVHFPPVFLCLERLALVKHLLSTAQCNIHLCPAMVIDEDKGWDNGKAGRLGIFEEMPYLTLGEQQLAVALGLVVGIAAIEIWRYVHALHPHLALDNVAICVYK